MTSARNILDYGSAGVVLTATMMFNQINLVLNNMVGHIGDVLTLCIQGATLVYVVVKTKKLMSKGDGES